jgi:hypothetical protein
MSSYSDFTMFTFPTSSSNLSPLSTPQPSVATHESDSQQQTTPGETLYNLIFTNLSSRVASARDISHNTTAYYKECRLATSVHLSEYASSHSLDEFLSEEGRVNYHCQGMRREARAAKKEVEEARQRLSLFVQWTYNPRREVCEWELAEYWRKLCHTEKGAGREWGIVTPPITPPQEAPQEVPQELSQENLSTIESLDTSDRTHTWLSNTPDHEAIEPPEIYEIPLYDAPIPDVIIEAVYKGPWRDGLDVDVWEEVHGCRIPW